MNTLCGQSADVLLGLRVTVRSTASKLDSPVIYFSACLTILVFSLVTFSKKRIESAGY
jgi:hypothetical protein